MRFIQFKAFKKSMKMVMSWGSWAFLALPKKDMKMCMKTLFCVSATIIGHHHQNPYIFSRKTAGSIKCGSGSKRQQPLLGWPFYIQCCVSDGLVIDLISPTGNEIFARIQMFKIPSLELAVFWAGQMSIRFFVVTPCNVKDGGNLCSKSVCCQEDEMFLGRWWHITRQKASFSLTSSFPPPPSLVVRSTLFRDLGMHETSLWQSVFHVKYIKAKLHHQACWKRERKVFCHGSYSI